MIRIIFIIFSIFLFSNSITFSQRHFLEEEVSYHNSNCVKNLYSVFELNDIKNQKYLHSKKVKSEISFKIFRKGEGELIIKMDGHTFKFNVTGCFEVDETTYWVTMYSNEDNREVTAFILFKGKNHQSIEGLSILFYHEEKSMVFHN